MNNAEGQNVPMNSPVEGGNLSVFSLLEAAHILQDRIERYLESVGLSSAKYGVLAILAEVTEPIPLGELADRVHCVRSNMTQLVDRLEADGLVQRTNDPSDRRVVRAELTQIGREKGVAGAEQIARVQAEFASSVSESDRQVINRLLSSLR